MKPKFPLLVLFLMALVFQCGILGAEPAGVTFTGGDGSSYEKAIVINGATEQTGVHAEYAYLAKHFPGCKSGEQRLEEQKKKTYDALDITTADGKKMTIYFDITGFFGKL